MSWHLVDGVALPDPVGGHPVLDFCNTRAGWGTSTPKEYLVSPRALALWAADSGLAGEARDDRATGGGRADGDRAGIDEAGALARALALREELYRCLTGRGSAAGWRLVSVEATAARGAAVLVPGDDGTARWAPATSGAPGLLALEAVARAAEDLLRSPLAACVAACPGVGCGWLFADPRRRRRWCSMAVCGNRAKARRHAARGQGGPAR